MQPWENWLASPTPLKARPVNDTQLAGLINKIDYRQDGYKIELFGRNVRIVFHHLDPFTRLPDVGYSGTAVIPESATRADVLRTVFGLFTSLAEQEAREAFWVDGSQPFSPHTEYYAMIEAGRHIQGRPFIPARRNHYAADRQLADEKEEAREDDNSAA